MLELRQVISDINLIEAQNRQFDNRKKMGHPIPINEYKSNEVRLEELYRRKGQLMQNIDTSEPQYQF
jgi:hypothetical protein